MAQKDRWEQEYADLRHLPSSRPRGVARAVASFIETHPELSGVAWDAGAGMGRNTIYLAEKGFKVLGTDVSTTALKAAQRAVDQAGQTDDVTLQEHNAGAQLGKPSETFSLVVDMMMLHLLDRNERQIYSTEINRTLVKGGFLLFKTLAADSEDAQQLIKEHPGPEDDSYILPESGMIEKCFTPDSLAELFNPLQAVKLDKLTEQVDAFGGTFTRTYYVGVMQK